MIGASPFSEKLAIAVLVIWVGLTRGGGADEPELMRQSESCMGTTWHIALYADDQIAANTAFTAAWQEIRAIDKALSNYSVESELTLFCNSGPHDQRVSVSEHLWTVLHASTELSEKTEGYFDVTIGPLTRLWRRARAKHKMPELERLDAASKRVGYQYIDVSAKPPYLARLKRGQMKIDLGGIAKGYAVDRALAQLRDHKMPAALVNGGGDLAAYGVTPEAEGWRVQIRALTKDGPKRWLVLQDAAVATSGDAWQHLVVNGKRYSHLIDPKTGIGSTRRLAVSVHAPSCMLADSLASAFSVMPKAKAIQLAKEHQEVAVSMVEVSDDATATTFETAGFPAEQRTEP